MNKVFMIGRLAADPELRTTQSGTPVATYRLAVNRRRSADGAQEADAGLDLYSREYCMLRCGESACFDTGVHVAIPSGYVGMLKSKSGLNVRDGLTSEGVIDSGYTGSIVVKLYNHGERAVRIDKGQKISQLVILPCLLGKTVQADRLDDTARGDGGFGSTGRM